RCRRSGSLPGIGAGHVRECACVDLHGGRRLADRLSAEAHLRHRQHPGAACRSGGGRRRGADSRRSVPRRVTCRHLARDPCAPTVRDDARVCDVSEPTRHDRSVALAARVPRATFPRIRGAATLTPRARCVSGTQRSSAAASPRLRHTYRRTIDWIGATTMKLTGKTALVTGGSRGIGAAVARRLARDGAILGIVYKENTAAAESVAEAIRAAGGHAELFRVDVTQEQSVQAMMQAFVARFGRIDILVNSAGTFAAAPVEAVSRSLFEEQMLTHPWSVIATTKAALPHF